MFVSRAYISYADPVQTGRLISDLRDLVRVMKAAAADSLAAYFLGGPTDAKILRELIAEADFVCLNTSRSCQEALQAARAAGKPVWLVDSRPMRYSFGFLLHRVGARGRWGLEAAKWGRTFDPLWPNQHGPLLFGPEGVAMLLSGEQIAEGVTDLRVLSTLQGLLKQAALRKVDCAEQQRALQAVEADVQDAVRDELTTGPLESEDGWGKMDSWRTQLRQAAISLHAKLSAGGAAP
jgi:hypothetical protein